MDKYIYLIGEADRVFCGVAPHPVDEVETAKKQAEAQGDEVVIVYASINPLLACEDAPPAVLDGYCAQRTADYKSWVAVEDRRSASLYVLPDGDEYRLGDAYLGQTFNGLGALPDWLTDVVRPSPAHVWDEGVWVFDEHKQSAMDAEQDAVNRAAFQNELDARMDAAVAIASPLDYANKRKKLPADKAARLEAFNAYIDQLAVLEYSDNVVWPAQPE